MKIENAQWLDAEHTQVSARIDGVDVQVPASPYNRHFADLQAAKIPIADFVSPPASVPSTVTPYQARKALLNAGLLELVDGFMATAPDEAQLAWEYATVVERDSPFIAGLSQALGLPPEMVDALFIAAGQI